MAVVELSCVVLSRFPVSLFLLSLILCSFFASDAVTVIYFLILDWLG